MSGWATERCRRRSAESGGLAKSMAGTVSFRRAEHRPSTALRVFLPLQCAKTKGQYGLPRFPIDPPCSCRTGGVESPRRSTAENRPPTESTPPTVQQPSLSQERHRQQIPPPRLPILESQQRPRGLMGNLLACRRGSDQIPSQGSASSCQRFEKKTKTDSLAFASRFIFLLPLLL